MNEWTNESYFLRRTKFFVRITWTQYVVDVGLQLLPSWIYILNANHKYAHKRFQFDFIKAILFTNQEDDVNIILKFDRDLVGQLDFTVNKILMFKYNVVLYA